LHKNWLQNATYLTFEDASWGYRPMLYSFRKFFLRATLASHIVFLYL